METPKVVDLHGVKVFPGDLVVSYALKFKSLGLIIGLDNAKSTASVLWSGQSFIPRFQVVRSWQMRKLNRVERNLRELRPASR